MDTKVAAPAAEGGRAPVSPLLEILALARHGTASLTVKLLALVGIFVALPIVLYGQFESADGKMRELVTSSIQDRSWLIAQALAPTLDRGPPSGSLNAELDKYSWDGTVLELMLQPAGSRDERSFYYVASSPRIAPDRLNTQLDHLAARGVLQRLSQSCTADERQEVRYPQADGKDEILTSVIPIQGRWGCWVLVSSHSTSEFLSTSIGRPYWETREVRLAALIYLAAVSLVIFVAMSMRRNLIHFRTVAREMREGKVGAHSFATRNVLPELASVAEDFDALVADLHNAARHIRQTAEDNAHSFKGPLATIEAALTPLRKIASDDNTKVHRALYLIDCSVKRLLALVIAAQNLDNSTAELLVAPHSHVDLTRTVADTLLNYRDITAERDIKVVRRVDEGVLVRGGRGLIEVCLENVIDNAISFSPKGGTITVMLTRSGTMAELKIEDAGPGVEPAKLHRIFERYFSERPESHEALKTAVPAGHAGLGLWIVRRTVEALGGKVSASNCVGGGLSIHIALPLHQP